ncbi:TPA: hypothetical protein HA246_07035 [Candidatus Woesearchaeota archaeon]|nr:hypothetical protein [Candidatus Woesearchaeota archaeon]
MKSRKSKKSKPKLFKRLIKCLACGRRFEAGHKLRLYCDRCKGKGK